MAKHEVVIVSAGRTPIGNFCGSFSSLPAHELGSQVIKAVLKRANLEPDSVSEVILGQALQAGEGQNPARQASIGSGLPITCPAYSINLLCGSGLKAIALGYQSVLLNSEAIVVAGGQESMSCAPHVISLRNGIKLGNGELVDTMVADGLTDAFYRIHMGVTAENVAKQYSIGRSEQDGLAVESQSRTEAAIRGGRFIKEIVPVTVKTRKEEKVVSADEFPRPATNLDGLSKLKPTFLPDEGTVTAGNASGINDGAAAVVLMSNTTAAERKLRPLARIVGVVTTGCDPKVMGLGPVCAVRTLLGKVGWKKDEVDLYEINEAFAAVAIACIRELGLDSSRVNVNGGAIALGHPIGASGARVLVTLLHALEQRGGRKGVASLCIGGGMGIAMAVEVP